MNDELPISPLSRQFGQRIRAHRKRLGLTQSDLAFAVGVNRRVIGRLERGVGTVRLETGLRAAHALRMEISLSARDEIDES